jgi:hypothetical protein
MVGNADTFPTKKEKTPRLATYLIPFSWNSAFSFFKIINWSIR